MPTMNVSLTSKMADFVAREVASGDYASASELVRDALRLLQREREIEREKIEALRAAIHVRWEQAERGEFSELDLDAIARAVLKETAA
jgi:antitoxin ParD1/3/4